MTRPPVARLVDDIAVQFAHLDPEPAAEAIANHVRMFWDPRMRSDLEHLPDAEIASLDQHARAAIELLHKAEN